MPKNPGPVRPKKISSAELSPLDDVRARLAVIWLGGCTVILLIVVLQSLLGKFGAQTQDAWGWLLPTIMPTLSMIVAVLGYTALDPNRAASVVRKSFFRIATYLSTLYLILILLTILVQPLTAAPPQELMNLSNLWLGPFQGLVASALGVLFVSKQPKPDESPD
jgi:hypothetical protein